MTMYLSTALKVVVSVSAFSGIVIHTVDAFGAVIEHVGYVLDSGNEVGGGWE